MNWKLKFTKKGTFIEFYDNSGQPIMRRKFKGWEHRCIDSNEDLVPKFELFDNEIRVKEQDNIFIHNK